MRDGSLHLVKIPLRAEKLVWIARRRGIGVRDLDEGYLVHCLLRELWQEDAPAPFALRGTGRTLDVWGYAPVDAGALISRARAFGDPSILGAMDSLDAISSRAMPTFEIGRRVGFLLRVCPVVRLARGGNGHHAGAEVDAYLARVRAAGADTAVSREEVYRDWFQQRMKDGAVSGASVSQVRVAGMSRRRVVRRTQGGERVAKALERPDVYLEGDLVIQDGARFLEFLAHGVGRHRAFGFGALMVVPPGTSHERR